MKTQHTTDQVVEVSREMMISSCHAHRSLMSRTVVSHEMVANQTIDALPFDIAQQKHSYTQANVVLSREMLYHNHYRSIWI